MVPSNTFILIALVFLATCYSMPSEVHTVISIPEACRGLEYCPYKPDGYEHFEEKMNKVLRQFLKEGNRTRLARSLQDEDGQFSEEVISPPVLSPKSDWHNCPYETKSERLYLVKSKQIEANLVVQTEAIRQVFDVVTCAKKYIPDGDEQCFQNLPIKETGRKSKCEEILTRRSVYVYNLKENRIHVIYASLPSACVCKVSYKP